MLGETAVQSGLNEYSFVLDPSMPNGIYRIKAEVLNANGDVEQTAVRSI